MAKGKETYKTIEEKVIKQRELVSREQQKLVNLETDLYKAFYDELQEKAQSVNLTVSEYIDAMG